MAASKDRVKRQNGREYHYQLSDQALENERLAHLRWREAHYERLYIYTPTGMKDELKALAEKRGVSLRELVIGALLRELATE